MLLDRGIVSSASKLNNNLPSNSIARLLHVFCDNKKKKKKIFDSIVRTSTRPTSQTENKIKSYKDCKLHFSLPRIRSFSYQSFLHSFSVILPNYPSDKALTLRIFVKISKL